MTNKTIQILFIMTVLMTSATAASVDLLPDAEALKSQGSNTPGRVGANSYGSANNGIVCGDRLCSEVEPEISATTTQSMKQPNLTDASLPLDIPLTMGYVDGKEVYYISTEASVEDVANHLTDLTGFPVTYTPALEFAPESSLAQIYVFTNGIEGSGVFGFQPQVVDSQPGDPEYSPLWNVNAVTWNEGVTPRELTSDNEVIAAKQNGDITIEQPGVIVNCPFVTWDGGQLPVRANKHISNDDPYGGGQVTNIDLENMKVTFVAHKGFAPNGDTIYYIATDASVEDVANDLGVVFAPKTADTISNAASSDLYVFTNGLEGNGPLGFQSSIGGTTTGDKFYSPLWRIQMATWTNADDAILVPSLSGLQQRASGGVIDTALAGAIVNCPFVDVSASAMKDGHKMDNNKMMNDKMMDKMIDEKSMMMDKEKSMMMDKMEDTSSSSMNGSLTAPAGEAPFGGNTVGTYSINVENGDHVNVTTHIKSTSSNMVLEGWLVDMDTGYKLSLGKADSHGKLMFSQPMVNPWIYDVLVITEEPIGDSDPAPNKPVGGVLLEGSFGL